MEASDRPKQAQDLPTCRKVQNGNSRVHQGLSDSRGMGVIDRPVRCLFHIPIHQNSRKYLQFCHNSQVFQFTSLPFDIVTPTVFTMILVEVKLMGLKPSQVFSFVGYKYHLDSALIKPTQERWLKLKDLILLLKSKHVLTARCLMFLIGLLASTE